MERLLTIKGIRAGSLFKILLIGHAFSFGLVIVSMGIFSLFGYETVYIGDVPAVGPKELISALLAATLFTVMFAFVNWVFVFVGNWLFTRFRPYDIVVQETDIP